MLLLHVRDTCFAKPKSAPSSFPVPPMLWLPPQWMIFELAPFLEYSDLLALIDSLNWDIHDSDVWGLVIE